MFYRKNLFGWEQALRLIFGLALVAVPLALSLPYLPLWLATAGGLVLTGSIGFCPACYLVGRKSPGGLGNKTAT